jgi:hypothetical protein
MSGFIYLWYDRKHERFYLGKHWGTVDDGYICSSTWMKNAYKRRSSDFKRKILEWVYTDRKDLADAEHRWGSMIKKEELGKKYYNLKIPRDRHWYDDSDQLLNVGQKISKILTGKTISDETRQKMSKPKSEEHRRKMSKPKSEEHRRKMSKPKSEEHRRKLSEVMKGRENFLKGKNAPIVSCPHCGKEGGIHAMKRWHFGHCKNRT